MDTRENYESIDGLKAIACIGIVMMHVLENSDYHVSGFLFKSFIPALTDFVFLFMCISAFGMCCGYYQRFIDKRIDISDFYIKRYKKILPFFSLLCLIDFAFTPSVNSIYEIIANLTLFFGFMPDVTISVIGVSWFLRLVFAFYLVFPFFVFLMSNKIRACFAFFVSFVINHLCILYFNAERTSLVYSFVYFMTGGIIFIFKNELKKISQIKYLALLGLIVSAALYFTIGELTEIRVLIAAFALIFAISSDSKNTLNNAFAKIIGSISFEIYLCHMLFFRTFERLHLLRLFDNDYINYVSVLVGVFICSSIFAFVVKQLLDKVMLSVERKIMVHKGVL